MVPASSLRTGTLLELVPSESFFMKAQSIHPPATQETWVPFLGRKIPWRKERLCTPVFPPGQFHGQKRLVGYSPWSCKESDTTERLRLSFKKKSRVLQKPFSSPGDLPDPGTEPWSPALRAGSLPSEPPGEAQTYQNHIIQSNFIYLIRVIRQAQASKTQLKAGAK